MQIPKLSQLWLSRQKPLLTNNNWLKHFERSCKKTYVFLQLFLPNFVTDGDFLKNTYIEINSSSNQVYKQTKKLLKRSERKKTGLFIAEGERIVNDAAKKGAKIEYVLLSASYSGDVPSGVKTYVLSNKLFDTVKETVNSQGIAAVIKTEQKSASEIDFSKDGCYLYLDRVADPGNLGTVMRSAEAFGVSGIIVSDGCADVYNPKVVRSTMSAFFDVNVYSAEDNTLRNFAKNGFEIIGTFPDTDETTADCVYPDKCVIVMGNEANGICTEVAAACTKKVKIPMSTFTESLNVSVACGIILYERFVKKENRGEN